jgi:hypothetical protein
MHRLPHEEENSLCYEICGSAMPELITKAIQDPDSLTYTEANLVIAGVPRTRKREIPHQSIQLNPNDRDLRHKALNAAQTEDEVAAHKTCLAKQSAESKACDAALESLAPGDAYLVKRAVNPPRPVPWQDCIMSLSGSAKTVASCGFTILYPKLKMPIVQLLKSGWKDTYLTHRIKLGSST